MRPREVDWNAAEHAFPTQSIDHYLRSPSDEDFVLERLPPSPGEAPEEATALGVPTVAETDFPPCLYL